MIAKPIPHRGDYGRDTRRCRIAFEVQRNRQQSSRTSPKAGTTSQIEHPRTASLGKGSQYANIIASINLNWGIS
ncbi:MAG: hypothetical protein GY820_21455, partial [Gammaproteobacteria bacterium]|nr:hypothetical protein [Gammaproteobacteria bacterium]